MQSATVKPTKHIYGTFNARMQTTEAVVVCSITGPCTYPCTHMYGSEIEPIKTSARCFFCDAEIPESRIEMLFPMCDTCALKLRKLISTVKLDGGK